MLFLGIFSWKGASLFSEGVCFSDGGFFSKWEGFDFDGGRFSKKVVG